MKSKTLATLLTLLPLLLVPTSCSSLETTYDYDTHTDFAAFREYGWMERSASATGSPLVHDRIVRAVDQELGAKGYVVSESPDFLLAARIGSETRVSVTDWGYSYGPYGSWWPRRDVSVQEYEVGTMILDVVEAKDRKLVWRGTAEDTIDTLASSEEISRRVDGAVKELLKAFPPGQETPAAATPR